MLASTSRTERRAIRAAIVTPTHTAMTTSGPDQPRTPSARTASARASANFVAGLRRRYAPVGTACTNAGIRRRSAALASGGGSVSETFSHRESCQEPAGKSEDHEEDDEAGDGLVDRVAEQALTQRGVVDVRPTLAKRGDEEVCPRSHHASVDDRGDRGRDDGRHDAGRGTRERHPDGGAIAPDVGDRGQDEGKRGGDEHRRPVPVSYTHLRAHETRHDLVCRLLLEKKKQ